MAAHGPDSVAGTAIAKRGSMTTRPRCSTLVFLALFAVACGGSGSTSTADGGSDSPFGDAASTGDGANDASGGGDASADGPAHTATHDCAPACGGGRFCQYPLGPGICPMSGQDSGFCPNGCLGCPALPPPMCAGLPAACGGTPSCDCLLSVCPGGCGSMRGSCTIDADGDWVIGCLTC
jgi:hypothetical protein